MNLAPFKMINRNLRQYAGYGDERYHALIMINSKPKRFQAAFKAVLKFSIAYILLIM